MPIIEKVRKKLEKFTGVGKEEDKEKWPTAFTTRKSQGKGMWQGDIGEEKPKEVDGKGDHSIAKPL